MSLELMVTEGDYAIVTMWLMVTDGDYATNNNCHYVTNDNCHHATTGSALLSEIPLIFNIIRNFFEISISAP